ncbi:MAG: histidine kinase dimerization/phospho-acceptor domain-containing protein [Cyanobacteria bacterium P01_A01_bin.45]
MKEFLLASSLSDALNIVINSAIVLSYFIIAIAILNDDLEARVQRRTQDLEAANRQKDELNRFAYIVSHDLKAPLREISNLSQWLEEDLEEVLTEDTRHQIELMRSRVSRMEGLINGLLEYSRAGRAAVDPEEVVLGW